jgi:hypothetical protein
MNVEDEEEAINFDWENNLNSSVNCIAAISSIRSLRSKVRDGLLPAPGSLFVHRKMYAAKSETAETHPALAQALSTTFDQSESHDARTQFDFLENARIKSIKRFLLMRSVGIGDPWEWLKILEPNATLIQPSMPHIRHDLGFESTNFNTVIKSIASIASDAYSLQNLALQIRSCVSFAKSFMEVGAGIDPMEDIENTVRVSMSSECEPGDYILDGNILIGDLKFEIQMVNETLVANGMLKVIFSKGSAKMESISLVYDAQETIQSLLVRGVLPLPTTMPFFAWYLATATQNRTTEVVSPIDYSSEYDSFSDES